jgi:hypothetical protein
VFEEDLFASKIFVMDELLGISTELTITVVVHRDHHPDTHSYYESYQTHIFRSNCENEERTYKRTSWCDTTFKRNEHRSALVKLLDDALDSYLWRHCGARLYDAHPLALPKAIARGTWWRRLLATFWFSSKRANRNEW